MYGGPGIGKGIGGAVGGGGALAATGLGQTGIFVVLAVVLFVVGALLLRSSSLKHRNRRP
ncbi:peptidase [Streptomyces sp. NPDC004629]|uniref:peptidase n=1 Tax=Streptomyces sp. NPDC004629 TaxID=3364705 RepID=UPI0036B0FF9A